MGEYTLEDWLQQLQDLRDSAPVVMRPGREQALVLTKLDEARLWAGEASA